MIRQAHEDCASCDELATQRPTDLGDDEYSVTIVKTMEDAISNAPTHWAIIERDGPWLEQIPGSPPMFTRRNNL